MRKISPTLKTEQRKRIYRVRTKGGFLKKKISVEGEIIGFKFDTRKLIFITNTWDLNSPKQTDALQSNYLI